MADGGAEAKDGGMKDGMEAAPAQTPPANGAPSNVPNGQNPPRNLGPGVPQQIYREEAKVRINAALAAEIGFAKRLVWFWSNHFCVSADKGPVRALCGAYEREAIRAHVLGRFRRHAASGREPSGDAALSRQRALDRTEFVGRALSAARA